MRSVQALGAQATEEAQLADADGQQLSPRSGTTHQVVARAVHQRGGSIMHALVWQERTSCSFGAITVGSLAVFLAYLARFFKPVEDLCEMTNASPRHRPGRIVGILDHRNDGAGWPGRKAAAIRRRDEFEALACCPDVPVFGYTASSSRFVRQSRTDRKRQVAIASPIALYDLLGRSIDRADITDYS